MYFIHISLPVKEEERPYFIRVVSTDPPIRTRSPVCAHIYAYFIRFLRLRRRAAHVRC
jgi:hypothetical protein